MVSSTEEPISNTQKSKKCMMANVKRNENGKQVATPEPVFPSSPEMRLLPRLEPPYTLVIPVAQHPPLSPSSTSYQLHCKPVRQKKIDLDPFLANELLQVPSVNIRHADSPASSLSAS